jgi:hypothetical protein
MTISRTLHEELRAFGFVVPAHGQSYTVTHVHIYRIQYPAGGRRSPSGEDRQGRRIPAPVGDWDRGNQSDGRQDVRHNERSADDEMASAFPYLIGTALLVSGGLLAIGYAAVKALI